MPGASAEAQPHPTAFHACSPAARRVCQRWRPCLPERGPRPGALGTGSRRLTSGAALQRPPACTGRGCSPGLCTSPSRAPTRHAPSSGSTPRPRPASAQVLDQEAGTTLYAAMYSGGARTLISAPAGALSTSTGAYKSWECTPDAGNATYRAIVEVVDTAADGTSECRAAGCWEGGGWRPWAAALDGALARPRPPSSACRPRCCCFPACGVRARRASASLSHCRLLTHPRTHPLTHPPPCCPPACCRVCAQAGVRGRPGGPGHVLHLLVRAFSLQMQFITLLVCPGAFD